ncbi:hypothetical protein N271_gp57 [Salmonella phage Jersey]|uniref:Uncharacterized protein n=1 Tax=Salmonella phage Jersey TaxID=1340534 RepID=S4X134_9CAUD|nr:hypothetical protein N271_gp57 [Salmonella phage Jersey]AGP24945.1 hypothetical protein Jersey_57 [Salmonella phage Jersey]
MNSDDEAFNRRFKRYVNEKCAASSNASEHISDIDEVKQVIHNLQRHIAGRDDEIHVLKDKVKELRGTIEYMNAYLRRLTSRPRQSGCRKCGLKEYSQGIVKYRIIK